MAEAAQGRGSARDLLAIYLCDHRAAAAAGLRLIRRARRQADRDEVAVTLAWLETEVDQDRRTLDSIMERLDISQSRWKTALTTAAERVARLKLNGRLVKRSPLSTLLELEALTAGVHAKRDLWQSLAAVAEQILPGGNVELAGLIDRATVQLERLQAHHDDAARHAFRPGIEAGLLDAPMDVDGTST